MGSNVFKIAESISISTTAKSISHDSEIEFNIEKFRVKNVAGIAMGQYGVFDARLQDPAIDSIGVQAMGSSLGEWVALAEHLEEDQSSFLVFGDAYGYAPIFYSMVPGERLVISDTFNGVMGTLKEEGVQGSLNVGNYVATLASRREQFASPGIAKTMANEIEILPMDRVLFIDSSKVVELPRSIIFPQLKDASYEELLEKGNQLTREVIRNVAALSGIEKGLLLSGGVDSRLVLSLILSADRKESFSIRTSDPRDYSKAYTRRIFERDASIANQIRQEFGLAWMEKGKSKSVSLSFRESLAAHQSLKSNFSYNFRPVNNLSVLEAPVITLRGGGGEILRATGTGDSIDAAINKNEELASKGIEEQFLWWYMRESNCSNAFDEEILDFVGKGFRNIEGQSLKEKLNNFYLQTRNRAHFGHARFSRSRNEIPVQFLSNIYYLEASRKIPFQDKAEGRMVLDIFSQTTPALLDFPFESPAWNARLASLKADSNIKDPDGWIAEFDELKKTKKKANLNPYWTRFERAEESDYNPETAVGVYLNAAFQLIENATNNDKLRKFHKQILQAVESGDLKANSLVAKVASAVDVFFPSVPLGANIVLETRKSSLIQTFPSAQVSAPVVSQDGWNNLPMPDIDPVLYLSDGHPAIDAQLSVGGGVGITYAFYLYRNGKRVEVSWYDKRSNVVFDRDLEPGTYRGQVFIKLPLTSRPVLVRDTPELTVGPDDIF